MSDSVPAHLARYASLLDDYEAFAAALSRPLPQTLALNPLRAHPTRLLELFGDQLSLTSIPWSADAWRLAATDRPGRLWGYSAGLYTIQEEASLLPARLLDATPGHRVLDLCAAPGNKTAHLAIAVGNRGTVIANDLKMPRLQALHDLCRRMGLVNISVTAHDGAVYPVADGQFDRVLVDAPCTSEGKAQRGYLRASSTRFRSFICGQQRALLQRALDLCRPGGRIVYSTCTFAPEENEAVVSHVLEASNGRLRALPPPVRVPGASPGLAAFEDSSFHPDLVHAQRLWPHRTGTGGFFAILLERCDAPAADGPPAPLQALQPAASSLLGDGFRRFDIPNEALEGLRLVKGGRSLRLLAEDHAPPADIRLEAVGLECAQYGDNRARLTTGGLLYFGPAARRNVIDLDNEALERWRRREVQLLAGGGLRDATPGAVLIRHAGLTQGSGLLRKDSHGCYLLESQYPKAWATPSGS